MKKLFAASLLISLCFAVSAQSGSNDNTFNIAETEFGFRDWFNNIVDHVLVQPDGKMVVGGTFTSYNGISRIRFARLNSDGSLDNTFNIGLGFNQRQSTKVIQADGKILVGGSFTSYNGVTRNRIVRLNPNGSLDNSFAIGTGFNDMVTAMVLQPDGKIIAVGNFTSYNGINVGRIARLNTDGSLDASFSVGEGFNGLLLAVALDANGRVVVGGRDFSNYNGVAVNRIARLNTNGTLDHSFNTGTSFNNWIYDIDILPNNKIMVVGNFTNYNNTPANGIVRLNEDGSIDSTFISGTGFSGVDHPSVFELQIQQDGKLLVGGGFTSYQGSSVNRIARLNSDGTLDSSFNVGTGFNNWVYSIAMQADGQVIVGGLFVSFNGQRTHRIARLSSNGALDPNFNEVMGFDFSVRAKTFQSDGKIIVGGDFTRYNRMPSNRIVRLNHDGSQDASFNIGTGFNNSVFALAIQSDGKILVGGNFTTYNGATRNRIVRLNQDGTLDANFNIGGGLNGLVRSIVIQVDGGILVGGDFTNYNGIARNRLVRLNGDGTIDTSFNIGSGFNMSVFAMALQTDGKILVGGDFTTYNGASLNSIARLNSDGTNDTSFIVGTGFSNRVNSIALQPNGAMVVGGNFTSFNGGGSNSIARLNTDGTFDSSFNIGSGFNFEVHTLAVQSDGRIVVGGDFTSFNGVTQASIIRLNANGALDSSFNVGSGFFENFSFSRVFSVVVGQDSRILVGGDFIMYNGFVRNRIARLNNQILLNPSISIEITEGTNPSCQGTTIAFLATATHGGATPNFQWQVNGLNVGSNSPVFVSETNSVPLKIGTF